MHSSSHFLQNGVLISLLAALALSTGCRSDVKVEVVDKPIKNSANQLVQSQTTVANREPVADATDLRWQIPPDWQATPAPRLVMARFIAPSQAILSISRFSGGGSDTANLTRWAGQLGIPFSPNQIDSFRRAVHNPRLQVDRYFMASDSNAFDIAVTRLDGTAWFFKLEGTPEAVEGAGTQFEAFLKSLVHDTGPSEPTTPVVSAPQPPATSPANPPVAANSTMAPLPGMEAQVAGIGEATWRAPSSWTAGPARAMRKGTYLFSGTAGQAELSITAFPGDVGGLAANINRWRGQIGLPALDEGSLRAQSISKNVGGYDSHIVWLQGDTTSIMGAIVPRAQDTWFFKATGLAGTLEEHRQAFADFLETVTF